MSVESALVPCIINEGNRAVVVANVAKTLGVSEDVVQSILRELRRAFNKGGRGWNTTESELREAVVVFSRKECKNFLTPYVITCEGMTFVEIVEFVSEAMNEISNDDELRLVLRGALVLYEVYGALPEDIVGFLSFLKQEQNAFNESKHDRRVGVTFTNQLHSDMEELCRNSVYVEDYASEDYGCDGFEMGYE